VNPAMSYEDLSDESLDNQDVFTRRLKNKLNSMKTK